MAQGAILGLIVPPAHHSLQTNEPTRYLVMLEPDAFELGFATLVLPDQQNRATLLVDELGETGFVHGFSFSLPAQLCLQSALLFGFHLGLPAPQLFQPLLFRFFFNLLFPQRLLLFLLLQLQKSRFFNSLLFKFFLTLAILFGLDCLLFGILNLLLLLALNSFLALQLLACRFLFGRDLHDSIAICIQREVCADQPPQMTVDPSLSGALSELGQTNLLDVELHCVNVEQLAKVAKIVLRYLCGGLVKARVEGSSHFRLVMVESFEQLFILGSLFHARPHEGNFLWYLFGRADSDVLLKSGSLQGWPVELGG